MRSVSPVGVTGSAKLVESTVNHLRRLVLGIGLLRELGGLLFGAFGDSAGNMSGIIGQSRPSFLYSACLGGPGSGGGFSRFSPFDHLRWAFPIKLGHQGASLFSSRM